jgi:rhodanese-related sulfurtransferase
MVILLCAPVLAQGKKAPFPSPEAPLPPIESLLRSIEILEAKQMFDSGSAVFVDGRPPVAFKIRHIKGALNCSIGEFEKQFAEFKNKVRPGRQVVVYCSSATCGLADKIGQMMLERGVKDIVVFKGGISAWVGAGYPTE